MTSKVAFRFSVTGYEHDGRMAGQQRPVQRLESGVEHRRQLPVPEPGGRVPRTEVDGPQHNPHVGHAVADAVVPVRTRHPVPDRAGGQPRDQAWPVLGDVGEQRTDRGRPERPVPEHQHVRFPGRDGTGAEERV